MVAVAIPIIIDFGLAELQRQQDLISSSTALWHDLSPTSPLSTKASPTAPPPSAANMTPSTSRSSPPCHLHRPSPTTNPNQPPPPHFVDDGQTDIRTMILPPGLRPHHQVSPLPSTNTSVHDHFFSCIITLVGLLVDLMAANPALGMSSSVVELGVFPRAKIASFEGGAAVTVGKDVILVVDCAGKIVERGPCRGRACTAWGVAGMQLLHKCVCPACV